MIILLDETGNILDKIMKCLIVDDDPLICDLLEHFCSKINEIAGVTTTVSGFESINLINSTSFDLIFLDYNLPDITGRDILDLNSDSAVIMVTSNKDFALDSYNYPKIVDFLVKPLDFSRFYKGVLKAKEFISNNRKVPEKDARLFIKEGGKLVKIKLKEVAYFKAEANYIAIVFKNKKVLTLMALKDLEPKLPDFFQRVHRSYIINLNMIDVIHTGAVEINKEHVPVSQRYATELLRKIQLLN
ncbi:LytTR family DNA-binding domain-containing protein [Arenibacter sp. ARW7G5Y1]|uniref:LytR/AlgR family response regulator transcription factor n=1 Tax=Arenibacter sp. ARW7G5Y1 TaxID=2135619 RepID=UPI000D75AD50|nr:LytTR family DNA-binding domain-containing protein [Arenibacter sp. ARW7G5Y1]PXX26840.1 LytTR family two component transcriptional regulator [Arenibacter sp. ARW7G5Y1]|tara:strand:- start:4508 stop:5239 length:732 start_codon:yes stop_codon:yes gene_type:complete